MSDHGKRGNGHIRQRGRVWWIYYYAGGKLQQESSKGEGRDGTSERDARDLLHERLTQARKGTLPAPRAGRVTLADLFDGVEAEYLLRKRRSLRRVLLARKHILAAFPDAKATDVKGPDLLRYASDQQAAGLADATIAYDLAILRHGYRLAVKLGTLDKCPVFTLPTPQNTRTGFFERPE